MIRNITRFDYPRIIEMLKNYRDVSGIECVKKSDNKIYVELLLNHIRAGRGIGLVACKNELPVGILLALLNPQVWDPEQLVLQELVYWMEPEARKSRLGYLLLKEYVSRGNRMKKNNQITYFTMTRRSGTNVNYSRFGFQPIDENWAQ